MDRFAFIERTYFFEIERKSKLQTALSLPIGVLAFSVAIGNFNLGLLQSTGERLAVVAILFLIAGAIFVWAIVEIGLFIIARKYRYIWSSSEYAKHYDTLVEFSQNYPDAPPADAVFAEQFYRDIVECTSHNTSVNDMRASGLWRLNVAIFGLVIILFLLSIVTVSDGLVR